MEFSLHTYDIQDLMICLIEAKSHDKEKRIITEADYDRLNDLLCSLNRLCTEENNYTLFFTVKA